MTEPDDLGGGDPAPEIAAAPAATDAPPVAHRAAASPPRSIALRASSAWEPGGEVAPLRKTVADLTLDKMILKNNAAGNV